MGESMKNVKRTEFRTISWSSDDEASSVGS